MVWQVDLSFFSLVLFHENVEDYILHNGNL